MAEQVGQTVPTTSTADGGEGGQEKPAVLIIGGLGAFYRVLHAQASIYLFPSLDPRLYPC